MQPLGLNILYSILLRIKQFIKRLVPQLYAYILFVILNLLTTDRPLYPLLAKSATTAVGFLFPSQELLKKPKFFLSNR
jgi:hypothetical protein